MNLEPNVKLLLASYSVNFHFTFLFYDTDFVSLFYVVAQIYIEIISVSVGNTVSE